MKTKANHDKVKVFSKDYIFHMVVFYWFIVHFSHNFSNWITNLRPKKTYDIKKNSILLHQALHYRQIYNFALNHHKFKAIIMFKDVWVSKFKRVYVFLFFECFEDMDPFLWNILKFIKKLKWFGEHLIRKKNFWNKKTTCPHAFLECFRQIKNLLKHDEFSWKFCNCNFESIRIYFKISRIFLIHSVPMVIFQKFFFFFNDCPHTIWLFFSCFHPIKSWKKIQDFVPWEKKSSRTHKECLNK
jgi:hypothetical protein